MTYTNWDVTSLQQPGDCGILKIMDGGKWEPIDCDAFNWFTVYICEHSK